MLPLLLRADLAGWVQSAGMPVWALALGGGQSLFATDFSGPAAILVGNEGAGLSQEVMRLATARVRIPMPGKMESLNAAAAAAVALFEAVRQRSANRGAR